MDSIAQAAIIWPLAHFLCSASLMETMRQKTRLFYINQYAVTPNLPGGTRHFELSKELRRHGIDTEIFAADLHSGTRTFQKRGSSRDFSVIRETFDEIPFHWTYTLRYRNNNWRRALSMASFGWFAYRATMVSAPPSLVVGSTPHPFAALAAQWAAKKFKVPFVLEIRDIWPQTLVDMTGKKGVVVETLAALADKLYHSAAKLIVLARGTEKYLLERGIAPEKIVYIPNGTDATQFSTLSGHQKTRVRQEYGIPIDKYLCIYAGAHGPANGLENVLRAAQATMPLDEDIHFVLVGDGTEKPRLMELADRLRLSNLTFLDPVAKARIPKLLLCADLGLLNLMKADVFQYGISPNKLFDYFAAYLPVVATTPGEIGHLVEQAGAGEVIEPENPTLLAEAISRWKNDPQRSKVAGERARAYLEIHFSRRVLGDRLAAVVLELTKQGSRA